MAKCIKTFSVHVQGYNTGDTGRLLEGLIKGSVTNSRSKPQQNPSAEKHAQPPRVVYCAIYPTLTRFTKFRVSNLHITSTLDTANTLYQRILPKEAIPSQ